VLAKDGSYREIYVSDELMEDPSEELLESHNNMMLAGGADIYIRDHPHDCQGYSELACKKSVSSSGSINPLDNVGVVIGLIALASALLFFTFLAAFIFRTHKKKILAKLNQYK
jgi:hypothetical protein